MEDLIVSWEWAGGYINPEKDVTRYNEIVRRMYSIYAIWLKTSISRYAGIVKYIWPAPTWYCSRMPIPSSVRPDVL